MVFQAWEYAEIPENGLALNRLAGSDPQGCIAGMAKEERSNRNEIEKTEAAVK